MREAKARGFDNAVMLDPLGHVAELATANIWLVKDGAAHTPVPNGTFLNGVTRQRVIDLLRKAGVTVHERSIRWQEFFEADEVFSTGNYAKVMPVTRVGERHLQPGPVMARGPRALLGLCARGTVSGKQGDCHPRWRSGPHPPFGHLLPPAVGEGGNRTSFSRLRWERHTTRPFSRLREKVARSAG